MSDLVCHGAGRDADNQKSLWFAFNRRPTDDELRFLHEVVKRAACLHEAGEPPIRKPPLRLVGDGPVQAKCPNCAGTGFWGEHDYCGTCTGKGYV